MRCGKVRWVVQGDLKENDAVRKLIRETLSDVMFTAFMRIFHSRNMKAPVQLPLKYETLNIFFRYFKLIKRSFNKSRFLLKKLWRLLWKICGFHAYIRNVWMKKAMSKENSEHNLFRKYDFHFGETSRISKS